MLPKKSYLLIHPNDPIPQIKPSQPYYAIIVVNVSVETDWQMALSDWLIATGCFYMSAWGVKCTTWDDSVDYALVFAKLRGEFSDDHFVMTTWHEKDSIEEAFDFVAVAHRYDTEKPSEYLFIEIGKKFGADNLFEMLDNAFEKSGA